MGEEAEIRKELERALGSLPDSVWEDLVEDKVIKMHLEGHLEVDDPEKSWEVLQDETQKRVRRAERNVSEALERMGLAKGDTYDKDRDSGWRWVPYKAPPDEPGKDQTMLEAYFDLLFLVGPKSTAMLQATSAYFGWLCNQHPNVMQFRDEVLGGRTLAPDEAHKLKGSYAARFFSLEWFLHWGIPVVGHASEIVGEYDWGSHRDEIDHRVTVRVDPPGITQRVRYAHPDTPILDEDEDQIFGRCVVMKWSGVMLPPYNVRLPEDPEELKLPEGLEEKRFPVDNKLPEDPAERPTLLAPLVLSGNYETPSRPTSVWPGSVVDELYSLAEELADALSWPGKDAAAQFILTGLAPEMCPIDATLKVKDNRHLGRPWRIEINAFPWVSAEEVARAYRRIQEQIVAGRNRLPDSKTLDVPRFVWEQEKRHGYHRPSWPDLCSRWNREHPKDQFEDYRHFRTYFKRAEKAVQELNCSRSYFDEEGHPDD